MAFHLRQLRKGFPGPGGAAVSVLDIPDFSLGRGEHAALTGPSGSGKTTLLHLVSGLLTPDAGEILFDAAAPGPATDLARLGEEQRDAFRARHIGYIFQTHHLLPAFTALENVLLGLSFTGRKPDRAWAERLLDEVGLGERLHFQAAQLSTGQRQRVAIARALASRPLLVLADEPVAALDAAASARVIALMRKLCAEAGAALLLVTHDTGVAAQFPRAVDLADINRRAAPAPVS